jgi:hypothetical protein
MKKAGPRLDSLIKAMMVNSKGVKGMKTIMMRAISIALRVTVAAFDSRRDVQDEEISWTARAVSNLVRNEAGIATANSEVYGLNIFLPPVSLPET